MRALMALIDPDAAAAVRPHTERSWRYRLGEPVEAVLQRLREAEGVAAYAAGRFPDLGDPVPARPFVAELAPDRFRIARSGQGELAPGAPPGLPAPQARAGYGEGGGMLPTLEVRGTLCERDGVTEIELALVRGRSARGAHRWWGFLVLSAAVAAWVALGSGPLGQRAMLAAVGLLFVSPALVVDLRRALGEREERRALLAVVERTFGPLALDAGAQSPYRHR